MRSLRLVALSDDGQHLVLAPDGPDSGTTAERFLVPIDDRLRAAARGDAHRVAQIEIEVGNALPPRIIQARIRAGETPEEVAHSSGTSVERIMRFAHPVLQERERVAEQAGEARVRLSEGTPSVPLEHFLAERLRLLGADVDGVQWDAHRTEDGTWEVSAAWRAGHKSGTTRWSYDLPAKTVTPVDAATMDFAEGTRLVRVVPDVPAGGPDPRRPIAVVRSAPAAGRAEEPVEADGAGTDEQDAADELGALRSGAVEDGAHDDIAADDEVRNVVPADGNPVETQVSGPEDPDELASRDTVVLGKVRNGEAAGEDEDPRARIPAWEDIVFGVRRHR